MVYDDKVIHPYGINKISKINGFIEIFTPISQ